MKIKLSELREFVKSIINEQAGGNCSKPAEWLLNYKIDGKLGKEFCNELRWDVSKAMNTEFLSLHLRDQTVFLSVSTEKMDETAAEAMTKIFRMNAPKINRSETFYLFNYNYGSTEPNGDLNKLLNSLQGKIPFISSVNESFFVNEQAGENTKKYPTPRSMTFKDSSGKTYGTGKYWMGIYDITEEYAVPNGTVYISTKDPNVKIEYNCLTNEFYIMKKQVFNPEYAKELRQRFCQTGGATPDIAAKRFIGQSIRFYEDVANTKEKFVIKVTSVVKNNAGILISGTSDYGKELFSLKCKDNFVKTLKRSESVPMLYNKKFIEDLKKTYCTTSAGGTPVTNVGKYSQVDQNAPMDVAEIRKIVKALVKEQTAPAAPQPDVNWQKIYSALKAYKNPLEQSGTYNGAPFTRLRWGIHQYYLEFVWDLDITSNSVSFTSLDNQNLKTFESLIGSLGFPTDSRNYMRKSITKDGKPAFTIIYNVDDWSKYDPNTVISTYKKIIDSMQGKAIEKK